jgi:hypothetical protein
VQNATARLGLELLLNTNPSNRATALVGVAFEIADLVLLQAWADLHGRRMIVELDHCVDGHEYEEIVAIRTKGTELRVEVSAVRPTGPHMHRIDTDDAQRGLTAAATLRA